MRPITKAEATVREVREAVATPVEACARRWREREARAFRNVGRRNDPVAGSWELVIGSCVGSS